MNFRFIPEVILDKDIKYPQLCRNKDGVYNICQTEEDMLKSNQWFGNLPIKIDIYSEDNIIRTNSHKLDCMIVNKEIKIGEQYNGEDIIKFWLNN